MSTEPPATTDQDRRTGPLRRSLGFLGELMRRAKEDNIGVMAKGFAYMLLFSIPALMILAVALLGIFQQRSNGEVGQTLHEMIDRRAPGDVGDVLGMLLDNAIEHAPTTILSASALAALGLALWTAATATDGLIAACNRAYFVRSRRGFVREKLTIIGITLVSATLFVASLSIVSLGERFHNWAADHGLSIGFLVDARWLLTLVLLYLATSLLYYAGPDVDVSLAWVAPGAIFASLTLFAALLGLRTLTGFVKVASTYGVMGGVILLLFIFFMIGFFIIIGAEINAILGRKHDAKLNRFLDEHPEALMSYPAEGGRVA